MEGFNLCRLILKIMILENLINNVMVLIEIIFIDNYENFRGTFFYL